MRQVASNRSCQICSSNSTSHWHTGQSFLVKIGSQTCEHDIDRSGWLCDECFGLRAVRQGKYQAIRHEVLEDTLKVLADKGACMIKDVMNLYKSKILDKHKCTMNVKVIGRS